MIGVITSQHKSTIEKKRTWTRVFNDTQIKLHKPDYYINKQSLKILLNHKTVGISLNDLIKGRKINGSKIAHLDNVLVEDNKIPIFLKEI